MNYKDNYPRKVKNINEETRAKQQLYGILTVYSWTAERLRFEYLDACLH